MAYKFVQIILGFLMLGLGLFKLLSNSKKDGHTYENAANLIIVGLGFLVTGIFGIWILEDFF